MNLNDEEIYVIEVLKNFLSGQIGAWDFDDLINVNSRSPLLRKISLDLDFIARSHPPTKQNEFADSNGVEMIRSIINEVSERRYV